jgi:hypothetical protein
MQPVAQDLKFIESASQSLSDYILSEILYWPMDDTPASLGKSASWTTLGLLFLVIEHIRRKPLNADQAERFAIAQTEIEKVHKKWKVAWEKKVVDEFKSRARQWYNFLKEYNSDVNDFKARYRVEVRNRVILQLLLLDLPLNETGLVQSLHLMDESLKGMLAEGDFIWSADLQSVFPEEKFWFLYRTIKG